MWISLSFSNLGFTELLGYVDLCLSPSLGSIWPLFLQIFFVLFSLLSFWGPITYMLVCSMVSHRSASFSINFSSCSSDKIILIDLSLSPLILSLPAQICCWIPLVNFSFQLLYFSTSEFLFLSPYWEIVLMWPWESFLISVRLKWFNDIIGMLSLISLDCPEN